MIKSGILKCQVRGGIRADGERDRSHKSRPWVFPPPVRGSSPLRTDA